MKKGAGLLTRKTKNRATFQYEFGAHTKTNCTLRIVRSASLYLNAHCKNWFWQLKDCVAALHSVVSHTELQNYKKSPKQTWNSLIKSTNQLKWFLWLLWKTSVTHTVSANQAPLISATAPFVQKGLMLLEQSITWPKNLQNHLFFGIFMRQGPEMTSCVCWRDFQKNLFSEEKHFLHTEMIHKFSDDSVKVFWSMLIHVMRHTNT